MLVFRWSVARLTGCTRNKGGLTPGPASPGTGPLRHLRHGAQAMDVFMCIYIHWRTTPFIFISPLLLFAPAFVRPLIEFAPLG